MSSSYLSWLSIPSVMAGAVVVGRLVLIVTGLSDEKLVIISRMKVLLNRPVAPS